MKASVEQVAALVAKDFGKDDAYANPDLLRQVKWIVAYKDGELAGYLLYWPYETHTEGLRMGVVKHHRRKGIAVRLIKRIIKIGKDTGLPYKTYAAIQNTNSINAHIKAGMLATKIDEYWFYMIAPNKC